MEHINLHLIKKYESPPQIVKIFSEKEIKMIQELYNLLPETVFNKKQNVRKKGWLPNYNIELDKIYFDKLNSNFAKIKIKSDDVLYRNIMKGHIINYIPLIYININI